MVEQAILLAPRVSALRLAAARIAMSLSDGQLALLHAELAIATSPADPVAHDLLAEVHDSENRPSLAQRRMAMASDLRKFDAALASSERPSG
ncbi:hypothetical protein L0V05_05545 [Tabrizicola sp. J26]|nr:hypothetical protein [Tabrizicola rongguiensis]